MRNVRAFLITFLGACALAAGCALRYPEALYDPPASELRFPGVYSLLNPADATRIIWIHGMCYHDVDWAVSRMQQLAGLLGATFDLASFRQPARVPDTSVEIYAAELSAPGGKAVVQMIVWSPLTTAEKRSLCFDNARTEASVKVCGPDTIWFPYDRAQINNTLKTDIMNTCLSDAILYVGQRGQAIRDAMVKAICFVVGGRLLPGNDCANPGAGADIDRGPLVLVAESLGSKLLTDAVFALRQTPSGQQAVDRTFGRTQLIYLFANQIPILDLASTSSGAARLFPGGDGLRGLVEAIRPPGGARLDLEDLFVVAFSDPNDILSYRLPKDYFGARRDVRVANVISSNSGTFAGLFENPAAAHTGYLDSASVVAAFICGNREDSAACRASLKASPTR